MRERSHAKTIRTMLNAGYTQYTKPNTVDKFLDATKTETKEGEAPAQAPLSAAVGPVKNTYRNHVANSIATATSVSASPSAAEALSMPPPPSASEVNASRHRRQIEEAAEELNRLEGLAKRPMSGAEVVKLSPQQLRDL